ncbi:CHASE2 domain-containing protein [Candidatus Poribacteria bacterium]|nr:CHASE2 domain-containing protein [Candidatus Poribacteria bacterium]
MFRLRGSRFSDSPIVIVAVDARTLQDLGEPPWTGESYAKLFEAVARCEPLAIGCLLRIPEAAAQNISANISDAAKRRLKSTLVIGQRVHPNPREQSDLNVVAPPKALQALARSVGAIGTDPDPDGVVRRQRLVFDIDGTLQPSIELQLLSAATGTDAPRIRDWSVDVGDRAIRLSSERGVLVNVAGPTRTLPYLSASRVLDGEVAADVLAGKSVMIGMAIPEFERSVVTSSTRRAWMPDVEVHASALYTALSRRPIWLMFGWLRFILAIGYGVVCGLLFRRLADLRPLAACLGCVVVSTAVCYAALAFADIYIQAVTYGTVTVLSYLYAVGGELAAIRQSHDRSMAELSREAQLFAKNPVVGTSRSEFWQALATPLTEFFEVDSMAFLEAHPDQPSGALTLVSTVPENARQTLAMDGYSLSEPPFSTALEAPKIVQGFVADPTVDSMVVSLKGMEAVVGFWVLSRREGRPYFEVNEAAVT